MKSRIKWFLFLSLILLLSGCTHVISKDLRIKSDPHLTLGKVRQNPESYKGKFVIWGGEIIETTNQKDQNTLVEVFQRPLDRRGEPKEILTSEGRFLVLTEEYLDPYIFKKGRKITVAGEILGERIKPVGEMEYRYPFLSSKQIYLWEDYYSSPYPYTYYDPLRGYPFGWWGGYPHGWWGYPYGGWGFGIRYHP